MGTVGTLIDPALASAHDVTWVNYNTFQHDWNNSREDRAFSVLEIAFHCIVGAAVFGGCVYIWVHLFTIVKDPLD